MTAAYEAGGEKECKIAGSVITAPLLFRETYLTLKWILDKSEKGAIEIRKYVAESVASAK